MPLILSQTPADCRDVVIARPEEVRNRPLRILLVNLMPDRAETERLVAQLLSNTPLPVSLETTSPEKCVAAGAQGGLLARQRTLLRHRSWDGGAGAGKLLRRR